MGARHSRAPPGVVDERGIENNCRDGNYETGTGVGDDQARGRVPFKNPNKHFSPAFGAPDDARRSRESGEARPRQELAYEDYSPVRKCCTLGGGGRGYGGFAAPSDTTGRHERNARASRVWGSAGNQVVEEQKNQKSAQAQNLLLQHTNEQTTWNNKRKRNAAPRGPACYPEEKGKQGARPECNNYSDCDHTSQSQEEGDGEASLASSEDLHNYHDKMDCSASALKVRVGRENQNRKVNDDNDGCSSSDSSCFSTTSSTGSSDGGCFCSSSVSSNGGATRGGFSTTSTTSSARTSTRAASNNKSSKILKSGKISSSRPTSSSNLLKSFSTGKRRLLHLKTPGHQHHLHTTSSAHASRSETSSTSSCTTSPRKRAKQSREEVGDGRRAGRQDHDPGDDAETKPALKNVSNHEQERSEHDFGSSALSRRKKSSQRSPGRNRGKEHRLNNHRSEFIPDCERRPAQDETHSNYLAPQELLQRDRDHRHDPDQPAQNPTLFPPQQVQPDPRAGTAFNTDYIELRVHDVRARASGKTKLHDSGMNTDPCSSSSDHSASSTAPGLLQPWWDHRPQTGNNRNLYCIVQVGSYPAVEAFATECEYVQVGQPLYHQLDRKLACKIRGSAPKREYIRKFAKKKKSRHLKLSELSKPNGHYFGIYCRVSCWKKSRLKTMFNLPVSDKYLGERIFHIPSGAPLVGQEFALYCGDAETVLPELVQGSIQGVHQKRRSCRLPFAFGLRRGVLGRHSCKNNAVNFYNSELHDDNSSSTCSTGSAPGAASVKQPLKNDCSSVLPADHVEGAGGSTGATAVTSSNYTPPVNINATSSNGTWKTSGKMNFRAPGPVLDQQILRRQDNELTIRVSTHYHRCKKKLYCKNASRFLSTVLEEDFYSANGGGATGTPTTSHPYFHDHLPAAHNTGTTSISGTAATITPSTSTLSSGSCNYARI
ncbi:unnamed protein product [Amoebophrya sp. A120]|nr:unnamed protein product [Amoebophrya sp. A120]|eukprot:GSA120T00019156001.1